ncbi:TonB-dependent receptor [Membranihabitans marinus]
MVGFSVEAQQITGYVTDQSDGSPLIGANVAIKGTTRGDFTNVDGYFQLKVDEIPVTIIVSYLGYLTTEIMVEDENTVKVAMVQDAGIQLSVVQIQGQRISEKQKLAPLTVESMDLRAIKESTSENFYDGLGNLKGVDLTAASLGFKVINTRGFNSTSPVRSLQIIDGVDNQSPGLNFSLGNFLGSPELDVLKVDIIHGASSAFYGPNAFNGVISIETKNPFYHHGLSASVKAGERSLFESSLRWADVIKNKEGQGYFAYKINLAVLRANDWVANNYDPIDDSRVPADNPGGYDAVNIYGDEYSASGDFSSVPLWQFQGLGNFYRTGYKEEDLVDYDTKNTKANVGLYWRLSPDKKEESSELVLSSAFANGTTIYQGDNRFALKEIRFFQHKVEWRKKDRFFLRGYVTHENAGKSYDPYFTALRMLEETRATPSWNASYQGFWSSKIIQDSVLQAGYPRLIRKIDENGNLVFEFDRNAAEQWLVDHNDDLSRWHNLARINADEKKDTGFGSPYLQPGTAEYNELFESLISQKRVDGGTLFVDKSVLYHLHGEYKFQDKWGIDEWVLGSNARLYTPYSEGTIFQDSIESISNFEYGIYGGMSHQMFDRKWRVSASLRMDKNENFDYLFSPAASLVYKPTDNNFIRISYSSAIRNPTLSDQYLYLDVGPALLLGNLEGAQNLVTIESLLTFFEEGQNQSFLRYFDVDPIQPEKVRTLELGYRTTLYKNIYIDAGYYFSVYRDFIGYNIGGILDYNSATGLLQGVDILRYSSNSQNEVQTQGASIGINYFFKENYSLQGNYSWNNLVKTNTEDPIIPAFNTPEHKFNIGFSGRDIVIGDHINPLGYNINYKWIIGYVFEGSPQFTGYIPTYDLLDLQVNYRFVKAHTLIKLGVTNVLDKRRFQAYGGPRVGRLAYISLNYELN